MPADLSRISVTAKIAAYYRQFSDIAFAREVARRIGADDAFEQILREHGLERDKLAFYAPMFEARYKSITQLAEIFDVQARGQQLNAQLQASLARSIALVQDKDLKHTSALVWFSSASLDIDPYVAGQKGIPDFMLNTLGVRNVVQSDEEWPTVGWETIAKANPTFLVIARMDRRRYPADDYQKKLQFLRSDPVTRNMDAVKNNRIIILDAMAMQASLRMFDGLESLATAINRYDLPK